MVQNALTYMVTMHRLKSLFLPIDTAILQPCIDFIFASAHKFVIS